MGEGEASCARILTEEGSGGGRGACERADVGARVAAGYAPTPDETPARVGTCRALALGVRKLP